MERCACGTWRRARPVATPGGHQGAVYPVAFSPRGDRLVSGGIDHTVRVWDVKERQQDHDAPRAHLPGLQRELCAGWDARSRPARASTVPRRIWTPMLLRTQVCSHAIRVTSRISISSLATGTCWPVPCLPRTRSPSGMRDRGNQRRPFHMRMPGSLSMADTFRDHDRGRPQGQDDECVGAVGRASGRVDDPRTREPAGAAAARAALLAGRQTRGSRSRAPDADRHHLGYRERAAHGHALTSGQGRPRRIRILTRRTGARRRR